MQWVVWLFESTLEDLIQFSVACTAAFSFTLAAADCNNLPRSSVVMSNVLFFILPFIFSCMISFVRSRVHLCLNECHLSVTPINCFSHTGIVQRWEVLQAQAVERQRQSSQVRELQRQVKHLRLSLEALGEQASELTKADDVDNRLKLIQKLQDAKVRPDDMFLLE